MSIPLVFEGKCTETYFKVFHLPKFQALIWSIYGPSTLEYMETRFNKYHFNNWQCLGGTYLNSSQSTTRTLTTKVGDSRTVWALKPPTFSNVHCWYMMLFHLYRNVQTMHI